MTQLDGKCIVVTGAARGIGRATAAAFVREGAYVAALDVTDDLGQEMVRKLNGSGPGRAQYHHCDISDRDSVDAAFAAVSNDFAGRIDVLANIAGVERNNQPAADITDEQWDFIFDVNVKGTLYTNQAAFTRMREHGGRIINFGSGAGLKAYPGGAHYSASKGAVMAWTRTIAQEWGQFDITANAVVPAIRTQMADEAYARMSPQAQRAMDERHRAQIPIGGKLGDPDTDLAPVMVFLASDGARFITGQIILVNGGSLNAR